MSRKRLQKACWLVWSWLLLASLLAACGAPMSQLPISMQASTVAATPINGPHATVDTGSENNQYKPTPTPLGPAKDQSFLPPAAYSGVRSCNNTETAQLADVNYDGKQDLVIFSSAGVDVGLSNGTAFAWNPTFQEFGSDKGWRDDKHVRTLADINYDGKQDIVGFGDQGVWIALSTRTGFATPFFYPEFGYDKGWRVDKHVRTLADINGDGRQDIVGFGDQGVWIALSTGTGFEAPQFVVHDFGYDQGWHSRSEYPRYLGDLNGDGYMDIVGFGEEQVFRALGGPTGLGSFRSVLREFGHNRNFACPRFLGDVDGDGMADLVGLGAFYELFYFVQVARSSDEPTPLPPTAPSNLQVKDATPGSLSLTWDDNSINERSFLVHYWKSPDGDRELIIAAADTTSVVVSDLDPDTEYCFYVEAESLWGISGSNSTCGTTN